MNVDEETTVPSLEKLSTFVETLEQKQSPNKNQLDSPQLVLKICQKQFQNRLKRRKTVLGEHNTNVVSSLRTQVQKKNLEIQRRSQENKDLKEKIRQMAMKHKEENRIVDNLRCKKEEIPTSVAKQMENIINKDLTKINPRTEGDKRFSFMGLMCCTDR